MTVLKRSQECFEGKGSRLDGSLAYRLVGMTKDFYSACASSFSDTRQSAWQGWDGVLDVIGFPGPITADSDPYRIVDIGCGNLRFEKMLSGKVTACGMDARIDAVCVDCTQGLLDEGLFQSADDLAQVDIDARCIDVIDAIARDDSLAGKIDVEGANLAVCFAVMHHIPLPEWRCALLDSMVDMVAPKGYIALSFWQYSKDEKICEKARIATMRAEADTGISLDTALGDHFLGWQDVNGCYRYCHDFSETDINELLACVSSNRDDLIEVSRFSADGRSGTLNRYVVLQRL